MRKESLNFDIKRNYKISRFGRQRISNESINIKKEKRYICTKPN